MGIFPFEVEESPLHKMLLELNKIGPIRYTITKISLVG